MGEVDRPRGGTSSLVYNKRKREGKRKKGPRLASKSERGREREKQGSKLGLGAEKMWDEDFSTPKQYS